MNTAWDKRRKINLPELIQSLKNIVPTTPPEEMSKVLDEYMNTSAENFIIDPKIKYED